MAPSFANLHGTTAVVADLPVLIRQAQIPAAAWIDPVQGTLLPSSIFATTFLGEARHGHANGQ